MQPMNKRQIEISADMNEHGYKVVLTINGREFTVSDRDVNTKDDEHMVLADKVESVYGRQLFLNVERHIDILDALYAAGEIIKTFRWLHGKRTEDDT